MQLDVTKNLIYIALLFLFQMSICLGDSTFNYKSAISTSTYVYDLWGAGASQVNDFAAHSADWSIYGFLDSSVTTVLCNNGYYFLGGPGLQGSTGFMARTYSGFTTHNIIYYSVAVVMGGAWTPSDTFSVQIDDRAPTVFNISNAVPMYVYLTCGGQPSFFSKVIGKLFHTSSSVTIKVSWNIVSNGSPFPWIGIKDSSFSMATIRPGDIEATYIGIGDTTIQGSTKCAFWQYYDSGSNSCVSCNSACVSCFGPTTSDCYQTKELGTYSGTTSFMCVSPCLHCWGTGTNQCFLCNSVAGYWLNQNNACQSTCTSPSVSLGDGLAKTCIPPCAANQFMLSDSTCVDSCDSPLIQGTNSMGKTCLFPCGVSDSIYLYWNGSCIPSCPYYQSSKSGVLFCNVCPSGQYMYQNGSCLSTCYSSFNSVTIGQSNFCNYPCTCGQFLYANHSCLSGCSIPFTKRIEGSFQFCDELCQGDKSECKPFCESPYHSKQQLERSLSSDKKEIVESKFISVGRQILDITAIVSTVLNPTNPSAFFFAALAKMPFYTRYMQLAYPSKLLNVFAEQDVDQLYPKSFIDIRNKFKEIISKRGLPESFQEYAIHTSFLVNFLPTLISLAIILIVGLSARASLLLMGRLERANIIFKKILEILQWNFLFGFFVFSYDGVVVYTSLELRSSHQTKWPIILSLLACIVVNLIAFGMAGQAWRVLRNLRRNLVQDHAESQISKTEEPDSKWKSYKIIYEDFKTSPSLEQSFFLLYSFRIYIYYIVIGYLFLYPRSQAIATLIINVSILMFIATLNPFRARIDQIQYLLQESVLLIINVCVLMISSVQDEQGSSSSKLEMLSDVFIICNIVLLVLGCLFIIIKSVMAVKVLLTARNNKVTQKEAVKIERITPVRRSISPGIGSPQRSDAGANSATSIVVENNQNTPNKALSSSQVLFNQEDDAKEEFANRATMPDNISPKTAVSRQQIPQSLIEPNRKMIHFMRQRSLTHQNTMRIKMGLH